MSSLNRATIIGHLGAAAELKQIPNGTSVCNFRIATSEKWIDAQGQKQEKTEWHKCVAWKAQAEACSKYLRKGDLAYVEGKIETRKWQDRDGNDRYTTEIKARQVVFLKTSGGQGQSTETSPRQGDNSANGSNQSNEHDYGPPSWDDNVPF